MFTNGCGISDLLLSMSAPCKDSFLAKAAVFRKHGNIKRDERSAENLMQIS